MKNKVYAFEEITHKKHTILHILFSFSSAKMSTKPRGFTTKAIWVGFFHAISIDLKFLSGNYWMNLSKVGFIILINGRNLESSMSKCFSQHQVGTLASSSKQLLWKTCFVILKNDPLEISLKQKEMLKKSTKMVKNGYYFKDCRDSKKTWLLKKSKEIKNV